MVKTNEKKSSLIASFLNRYIMNTDCVCHIVDVL